MLIIKGKKKKKKNTRRVVWILKKALQFLES